MRALIVAFALVVAVPAWTSHAEAKEAAAETDTPSNAPFRTQLLTNAAVAQRAAKTLASIAKQPAPAKLSSSEHRLYVEHSKWLSDSAGRLASLHTRMEIVLAKGAKAPVTEIATINMELVTTREAIEAESPRFNALAKAARPRHAMAMNVVRADK